MRLGVLVTALCCLVVGLANAGEVAAAIRKTHIEPQALGPALKMLAREFDFQVLYQTEVVGGITTRGVSGAMTAQQALQRVLSGTGLTYKYLDDKTVTIVTLEAQPAAEPPPPAPPAPPPSSANTPAVLELKEIIVTAERRAEKLQDVPMAVSAVSADQIDRLRIANVADLARNVPSLTFAELSPGEVRLSMRGITSQPGLASVVGYYLDDVAFENRSGIWAGVSNIDYFDLDRIEVLRGPQGTLFGAGAMGGAIRLITARPDPTRVEFKAEGGVSTFDGGASSYSAKAAYNQPLASNLALRAVVTQVHTGGFIDGATTGDYANLSATDPVFARNENDSSITTVRAALRWTPLDSLTVTPGFLYRHSTAYGFDYFQSTPGPRYVHHHVFTDRNYNSLSVATLDIEQQLGFATLTSITSYQKKIWNGSDDYSQVGGRLLQAFTDSPTQLALPLLNRFTLDFREVSQELRLASSGDSRLKWIVGARYMHFEDKPGGQYIADDTLGPIVSGIFGIDPPQSLLVDSTSESDSGGEVAGFGELSYAFTRQLEVTAGLRAYRLKFVNNASTLDGLLGSGPAPRATANKNGTNPKVNVNYHFTPDVMAYVSATKGYRPGGPNEALLGAAGDPCQFSQAYRSVYDPDSVWTYELGAKSTLLNRILTVNAAVYRTNWTGIQGSITSNCGEFIANLGDARVKGAELEMTLRPMPHLDFTATASYNDARFMAVDPVLAAAVSISRGDRVVAIPKAQFSLSGEYTQPLTSRLTGYLRADAQYVGSAPMSYTQNVSRSSYTAINAAVGGYFRDFEASLYVNNLANRLQVVDIVTTTSGPPFWVAAPPRTVGLMVRANLK